MSRGKTRARLLGIQGMVNSELGDDYGFIYKTSLVRDERFYPGYECRVPGVGNFVYSKSSGACIAGQGCEFTDTGVVAITTLSTAQSVEAGSGTIGSKVVEIPAATHATLTEDQLRGGFAIIYNGTNNNVDFRQIVGNDASTSAAALTIYLAAGVSQAITTSSKIEIFANPFSALRTGTSDTLAKAGRPASPVAATLTYFWCQVGEFPSFCWNAPHEANVGTRGGIGCFWRADGSIESATTALGATIPAADTSQYAGHTVAGSHAGNGPLFNLR
jgi:hypothetical protein